MPVIPKGIPPFTIKAPLTSTDRTGAPTDDVLHDAKRVFDLIEDERHLTAMQLYKSVKTRVETWDKAHKRFLNAGSGKRGLLGRKQKAEKHTTPAQDRVFSDAKAFLQQRHTQIVKLEVSGRGIIL